MAFTVSCGVIETVNNYSPVSLTASAEEQTGKTAVFDGKTGTLTLKGNVVRNDVIEYFGEGVKTVVAEKGTVLPESCFGLFQHFTSVETIDLSEADTSKVTNMNGMFSECIALKNLDLSSFDTSNVTDMCAMFSECYALESLDLTSFNTSKVTDMSQMFLACRALKSIDLSGFDTSSVKDMQGMFDDCMELTSLDLTKFDTSKVISMRSMFYNCKSLTSLDLTKFNTSKVTDMGKMFLGCEKLSKLDLTHFDTSKVTDMRMMFERCSKLDELDIHNFDTSNVIDISAMFMECESLKSVSMAGLDLSNVTNMSAVFCGCKSLKSVDMSGSDTSKAINMMLMFNGCTSLETVDLSSVDTSNVEDMTNMFWECDSLKKLDLSGFNTSRVTSMRRMFGESKNLETVDISGFTIKEGCEIGAMFTGCTSLKTVYVSDSWKIENIADKVSVFDECISIVGGNGTKYDENKISSDYARIDTADAPGYFTAAEKAPSEKQSLSFDEETGTLTLRGNVVYDEVQEYKEKAKTVIAEEGTVLPEVCSYLFSGFKNVEKIDLSKADASKVKYMISMFSGCLKLTSIDLSDFDTSNVVIMNRMFDGCTSLLSLDLSSFDTSKVESMFSMFFSCDNLQTLDLSSFNTVNVHRMHYMFDNCSELKSVYVGERWVTEGVIKDTDMFEGCIALAGGNGTKYDDNKRTVEYAHVDEPDNPGYFSVHEGESHETPAELKSIIVKDGALTYRVFEDHAEVFKCDEKAEGDIIVAEKVNGKPVTKIAVNAFSSCSKITSFVMPDTVKEIGIAAFSSCSISDNFTISQNLERVGVEAFRMASLPSLELPASLKDIELEAFERCYFKELVMSEHIEKIDISAFKDLSANKLTILNPDCDIYDSEDLLRSVHVIIGHRGSTAEAYAKKYSIMFYALEDKPVVWGDANCDGGVDMADIVLIMQSLANPNRYGVEGTDEHHITVEGQTYADVSRGSQNEANGITGEDALLIQKYLLGRISSIVPKMP